MYCTLNTYIHKSGRESEGGVVGWGRNNTISDQRGGEKVLTKNCKKKKKFNAQVQWYEIEQVISFSPICWYVRKISATIITVG